MSLLNIFLGVLTFGLIVTSLFMILVVLMQKAKADGGMGAAMGGGMAEAAFGADTGNVLSKSTIYAAITFFVLAFTLYLGRIYQQKHSMVAGALPNIAAPAVVKPAAVPTAAPAPIKADAAAPAATTPAPATPDPVKKP